MEHLVYGFIGLLLVFVAIVWFIFPFIVVSKFNELMKIEKGALEEMRKIDNQLREIARAMQWLVENTENLK